MKKGLLITVIITLLFISIVIYFYYQKYKEISTIHFNENTPPAIELTKVNNLVGSWIGEGKIYESPNSESKSWTSVVHHKKVFGDHYIQTIEHKNLGDKNVLSAFGFISWDWGDKQFKKMQVSNFKNGSSFETMYLINDNSFLTQYSYTASNGTIVLDQVTTKLYKDTYTVIIKRSINGAPSFIYSEGNYKRTSKVDVLDTIESIKNVPSLITISEDSKWLANMMGGKYKANAKVEAYNFNVNETSTPILGGNAVITDYFFEGDDNFTGYNVMTWNEEKKRITGFMLDNRGVAVKFEGIPDMNRKRVIVVLKTILTHTAEVERWVWDVDDKKGMVKSMSHVIHGIKDPVKKITFNFKKVVDFKKIE